MIKCLVSDLDGTLLLHGSFLKVEINKHTVQKIAQIRKNNVDFVIATGRTHDTKHVFEKQLGFSVDFIGNNGSCIMINDELVVDRTLPVSLFKRLVEYVSKQSISAAMLYVDSDGNHVFDDRFGHNNGMFKSMSKSGEISSYFEGDIDAWYKQNPTAKMFNKAVITVNNVDERNQVMDYLQPFVEVENVDMFYSADVFIEIMPKDVNKGFGIQHIKKEYGLLDHEIAVVGDSFNDVSMFQQFSTHSFAMESAPDEVKAYAKNIVHSVDDVIDYIIKFNQ